MPTYKYGGRTFTIAANFPNTASTAANSAVGAYNYLPSAAAQGVVDFAGETIRAASLVFLASLASSASTAAGGSVQVAASQFNSGGSSVSSAILYDQSVASVAANTPLDVSTKFNGWVLSPGDVIELFVNSHTVGIPATFPNLVLSATIDNIGA